MPVKEVHKGIIERIDEYEGRIIRSVEGYGSYYTKSVKGHGSYYTKMGKALCSCGDIIDIKPWNNIKCFRCRKCGNTKWDIKNTKGTGYNDYGQENKVVDLVEYGIIIYIKNKNKIKVNWEDRTTKIKKKSIYLVVDFKEKNIYGINEDYEEIEDIEKKYFHEFNDYPLKDDEFIKGFNRYNKGWEIKKVKWVANRGYGTVKTIKELMRHPNLSLLINEGLSSALENVIEGMEGTNINGTNACDILGVNKSVIEILSKNINGGSYAEFKNFIDKYGIHKFNILVDYNIINRQNGRYIGHALDHIEKLVDEGYDLAELLRYTQNSVISTGRESWEILGILSDYIDICREINVEYKMFPNKIYKAHNEVAKLFKIKINEESEERFSRMVEINKKLEYKGKEYSIAIPERLEEIGKEGEGLNHCVASYTERILKGESSIFFMRKNREIDKPFITLETKNNEIVQARGFNNRRVDKEEKKFLRNWAEKKGIRLGMGV